MTRPAVTVIVCTRQRPELLGRSLPSIAASMRDGDELLVVESGGEHSVALVAGLPVDGRVVLSERREKSYKLNRAIAGARSALLVLTDDDVEVPAGWIDALVAPLVADPAVGAAFGPVRGLSGVGQAAPDLHPGPAPLQTWAYAHGASMALRRTAIEEAGGFDERLGPGAAAHGEEHDALLRVWECGWEAAIADAPPVTHMAWRSATDDFANMVIYERGAGAFLGAALRRRPSRWWKYAILRAGFELSMARTRTSDGRRFGRRSLPAFVRGLGYGMRMPPKRYL